MDLAATRKEAQAAGLLQEEDDDNNQPPAAEKKLDEVVATDPYIQMSLFLMKEKAAAGPSVGASR